MDKGAIAIIVAIIGVIGVVIGVYLHQTGAFTTSDIRFARQQSTDDACPSSLNTNSGEFTIFFSNQNGNRGTDLTVELNSPDDITFTKNKNSINIPSGQTPSLEFIINISSLKKADRYQSYILIDNVTINILGEYVLNNRGEKKSIQLQCRYNKQGDSLLLTK